MEPGGVPHLGKSNLDKNVLATNFAEKDLLCLQGFHVIGQFKAFDSRKKLGI